MKKAGFPLQERYSYLVKFYQDDDPADVVVLKDDKGAILIRQEVDDTEAVLWLSNKAALEIATWILDNVSEVME